jgi:hypothetical protein
MDGVEVHALRLVAFEDAGRQRVTQGFADQRPAGRETDRIAAAGA